MNCKIDIFSGFLGAGKTTLIKKLISESYAGQKLVLIENEFGEIGIDGGFLQDAGINITEMNSGCICCSLVGDFGKALQEVIEKFHPDRVIIEPSGVGKLSDVAGHSRHFEFGTFKGKKIVLVSRFHFYESGSAENMWILYTLLHKLGVKSVIATTATGGINPEFKAGDIMLIKDHINLSGENPLIGHLPIEFVDMTNAYDKDLRDEVKKIAKSLRIKLQEGVHVQALGPTYETPAEVIFYRNIGGDSVSMSSAHGNICAKFYKMRFVAFASISNEAATYDSPEITHEEVLRISRQASQKLGKIIEKLIPKL